MMRNGPPLPFPIFMGKATTYNPVGGNLSNAATFSNPGLFAPKRIWWVLKSYD
jgi:hypothetical protein